MNLASADSTFHSTRWTLVLRSRGDAPEARTALGELCEVYWAPVFRFLRSEGRTDDDSRELAQEFFARLLSRGGVDGADPAKGRFRSYLLRELPASPKDSGRVEFIIRRPGRDARELLRRARLSPEAGLPGDNWSQKPLAAGSPHGHALALEWIDSKQNLAAEVGWCTLSGVVALKSDEDLNFTELKQLLQRVRTTIHQSPNNIRYAMNNFVIAVATYVAPLTEDAIQVAEKIGRVEVDMGNTACQVPFAPDYIKKCLARNPDGKKRKTVKC